MKCPQCGCTVGYRLGCELCESYRLAMVCDDAEDERQSERRVELAGTQSHGDAAEESHSHESHLAAGV
jgi:hypothetical protein